MHAIRELMAGPEIPDPSTSDFPVAWASRHSRVVEGFSADVGVDSKATLERRVEK